jgi:hypothetical protein
MSEVGDPAPDGARLHGLVFWEPGAVRRRLYGARILGAGRRQAPGKQGKDFGAGRRQAPGKRPRILEPGAVRRRVQSMILIFKVLENAVHENRMTGIMSRGRLRLSQ